MSFGEPPKANEGLQNWVVYFIAAVAAFVLLLAWDPVWKSEGVVTGVVVGNIQQVSEFSSSEDKVQIRLGGSQLIVAKTGKYLGYPHVVGSEVRVARYRSLIFAKTSYQVSPQ